MNLIARSHDSYYTLPWFLLHAPMILITLSHDFYYTKHIFITQGVLWCVIRPYYTPLHGVSKSLMSCWKALGKVPAFTRFTLFQSKDDFNNRRETLIIKGYKEKVSGPGSAAKHFVEKGTCEPILLYRNFITNHYTLLEFITHYYTLFLMWLAFFSGFAPVACSSNCCKTIHRRFERGNGTGSWRTVKLSLPQPDCLLCHSQHPCAFQDPLYQGAFSPTVL